jgi:mRNA interferase MazF
MTSGTTFRQGDIAIVPFPFTNLSAVKQRPVLIISNNTYNEKSEDVITAGITSNLRNMPHSVLISSNELEEGDIPKTSRIKADKLFTLDKTLIKKKVAKVNAAVLKEVKEELLRLV